MSAYQLKLVRLFAALEKMNVNQRVDYCNTLGLYYPFVFDEIKEHLGFSL
jgi:hypothetical protein